MRIKTKIFLLISCIALIFTAGVILFKITEDEKIENLFHAAEKEKTIAFHKNIHSIGKDLEVFAYDYSYWDELVEFMNTKDQQWAEINILEALATYNADYVWLYKPDFRIFFQSDSALKEIPLSRENLLEMFKDTLFSHFFITAGNRLLEIRSAPIQVSSDAERKTRPQGYFFTGRLWDDEFLKELSLQTSSRIEIIPADSKIKKHNYKNSEFIAQAHIHLPGWNGKPAAGIISLNELPMIGKLNESIRNQVLYSFILSLIILVITAVFLIKNINQPLKTISKSLEEEKPEILDNLLKDKAEFGKLSLLINQFFIQREKLLSEITQRKLIESSLQESENKYRKIFENVQDVVFQADNKCLLTSVSPSVEKYSGYKPQELIGKGISGFFSNPEDTEKFKKELNENGEVSNFETVLKTKSGDFVTVLVNSRLMYDEEGNLTGSEGVIRDISLLKLSEEKIKKLSRAVEQSPVSIVITDTSGKIEYVNPKFEEISGYSFEEVMGRNPRILKSGFDSGEKYEELWRTILSGKEWKGELLNRKKNGELYWEAEVISPLKNANNVVTNFIAIKEDITERKKIENELKAAKEKAEEMNKLKSAFLANMSHELRTPLIGILGFSEILSAEVKNDNWKEMLQTITSGGERLLETLNQILDLSKFESDKINVKYEPVEVNELLMKCVNLMQPYAEKKNLYLKTDIPESIVSAKLDKQLLHTVISNILGNAIKFTETGGVSVYLRNGFADPHKYMIIKVSDTGIGIPKKYQKIIFDEFRQVSEGFDRRFEGTGLGLTIAKRIVETFKGEINVESEPGKGSEFIIKLPLDPVKVIPLNGKVKSQKDPVSIPAASGNKNILFVDDDETSKRIVKIFLKNKYKVDTASDQTTGLQLIEQDSYSLILLDINLGAGGSGSEILKEIRKKSNYNNTPVVAVTAYALAAEKAAILAEGFTDYISKPFSRQDLTDLVNKYLSA